MKYKNWRYAPTEGVGRTNHNIVTDEKKQIRICRVNHRLGDASTIGRMIAGIPKTLADKEALKSNLVLVLNDLQEATELLEAYPEHKETTDRYRKFMSFFMKEDK